MFKKYFLHICTFCNLFLYAGNSIFLNNNLTYYFLLNTNYNNSIHNSTDISYDNFNGELNNELNNEIAQNNYINTHSINTINNILEPQYNLQMQNNYEPQLFQYNPDPVYSLSPFLGVCYNLFINKLFFMFFDEFNQQNYELFISSFYYTLFIILSAIVIYINTSKHMKDIIQPENISYFTIFYTFFVSQTAECIMSMNNYFFGNLCDGLTILYDNYFHHKHYTYDNIKNKGNKMLISGAKVAIENYALVKHHTSQKYTISKKYVTNFIRNNISANFSDYSKEAEDFYALHNYKLLKATMYYTLLDTNIEQKTDIKVYFDKYNKDITAINEFMFKHLFDYLKINDADVNYSELRIRLTFLFAEKEYILFVPYYSKQYFIDKSAIDIDNTNTDTQILYTKTILPYPPYTNEIMENMKKNIVVPFYENTDNRGTSISKSNKTMNLSNFFCMDCCDIEEAYLILEGDNITQKLYIKNYMDKIKTPFCDNGSIYNIPIKISWIVKDFMEDYKNDEIDENMVFKNIYVKYLNYYLDEENNELDDHIINIENVNGYLISNIMKTWLSSKCDKENNEKKLIFAD